METLREQLLAAGMTEDQLGNWSSDLYVLKTPISTKVLESYEFKSNVTTFRSETEPYKGKIWYEIPFAYVEHYQKKTDVIIPESRREFVRQYANKYLVEHSQGKPYNMTNEYFDELFKDCALPLRPVFYPMLREEIQKLIKEVN